MAIHLWAVTESSGRDPAGDRQNDVMGYAAGLATWMLAGSVVVAVKLVADEMPPWTMVCFRTLISAAVLLPFVASHLKEMVAFLRARWKEAALIGAIGLGLTQGLMFSALHLTSAVNVGIVFGMAPMITMVLARFVLGERMNLWQGLGSAVAFCGIVVIAVQGSLPALLGLRIGAGDLLAFTAALFFAGYTVLLKRARFALPAIPLMTILLMFGSLASFPFFMLELWNGHHEQLGSDGLIALFYCAIIGGSLMYLLYKLSVDLLGASRAGTLIYTEMLFVALFAWLLLGERLESYHYIGAGLVIAGVLLVTMLRPEPAPPPVT